MFSSTGIWRPVRQPKNFGSLTVLVLITLRQLFRFPSYVRRPITTISRHLGRSFFSSALVASFPRSGGSLRNAEKVRQRTRQAHVAIHNRATVVVPQMTAVISNVTAIMRLPATQFPPGLVLLGEWGKKRFREMMKIVSCVTCYSHQMK